METVEIVGHLIELSLRIRRSELGFGISVQKKKHCAFDVQYAGWNSRFLFLAEFLETRVATQRVPLRIEP